MLEEIRKIVAQVADVNVKDVLDETNFINDLELDSMDILELVTTLEKRYKIDIPDTKMYKLVTVLVVQEEVNELLLEVKDN